MRVAVSYPRFSLCVCCPLFSACVLRQQVYKASFGFLRYWFWSTSCFKGLYDALVRALAGVLGVLLPLVRNCRTVWLTGC